MYYSATLTMLRIKTESKMKTLCKYAVFYCNVNFVTAACVFVAFIFIASTGSQSASDAEKSSQKENATHCLWRVAAFIWIIGTKLIFLYIFTLMFLWNIYYRYVVFFKIRKILIEQQRSNNIGILGTKHAKFTNCLTSTDNRRLCCTQNSNWL